MDRISFDPLPMEAYEGLPDRERQLQAIGDVIGYWLKWVTKEHEAEALPVDNNTHIMLGYDNAPPNWPTVGQLTRWLRVLRDSKCCDGGPQWGHAFGCPKCPD